MLWNVCAFMSLLMGVTVRVAQFLACVNLAPEGDVILFMHSRAFQIKLKIRNMSTIERTAVYLYALVIDCRNGEAMWNILK